MTARFLTSTVFRLLVTAGILAYLVRDIDLGHTLAVAGRLSPWWGGATLALVAVDRVLMIVRWVLLLRSAGVHLTAGEATRIFLVSSFVGSFLPAGVGGDASRAYAVASQTAKRAQAVASVAVDRILGLVAIAVLGGIGLVTWAQHLPDAARWPLLFAATAVLAIAVSLFWTDRLTAGLLPVSLRRTRWGAAVTKVGVVLAEYRQQPGVMATVFALSLAVQAVRVLQGYTLGRGIGIPVGLAYYLVFMPIGLLMMLLPVSISGFGLPQGVMVWMLEPVGVPRVDAFALSTLIVLLGLVGNLPGACLYLGRKKPLT